MTSEENEKRDCREARFSFEGRKPCPNLGKHLNLSVNNIVHELNRLCKSADVSRPEGACANA